VELHLVAYYTDQRLAKFYCHLTHRHVYNSKSHFKAFIYEEEFLGKMTFVFLYLFSFLNKNVDVTIALTMNILEVIKSVE
jgi:hypothetical protein